MGELTHTEVKAQDLHFTLSSTVLSESSKRVSRATTAIKGAGKQVSFNAALTITSQSAQFVCASAEKNEAMQETAGKTKVTDSTWLKRADNDGSAETLVRKRACSASK